MWNCIIKSRANREVIRGRPEKRPDRIPISENCPGFRCNRGFTRLHHSASNLIFAKYFTLILFATKILPFTRKWQGLAAPLPVSRSKDSYYIKVNLLNYIGFIHLTLQSLQQRESLNVPTSTLSPSNLRHRNTQSSLTSDLAPQTLFHQNLKDFLCYLAVIWVVEF